MQAKFHIGTFLLVALLCCQCEPHALEPDVIDLSSVAGESTTQRLPTLGAGTSQDRLRTFRRCVTKADSTAPLTLQASAFHETPIHSREQLNEVLALDVASAASGIWGEASGSGKSLDNLKMVDENFYWLVYTKNDFTMGHIDPGTEPFSLTEDAKEILKNHGVDEFYRTCGTSFYTGLRVEGHHAVLYEFLAHDEKSSGQIKKMGSCSGFGLKTPEEFEHVLSLAIKSYALTIHSFVRGSAEAISEHAMDPKALTQEFKRLKEDLAQDPRGIAVESTTQSYDIFEEVQEAEKKSPARLKAADLGRRDALSAYYALYTQNQDRLGQIRALLVRGSGAAPWVYYSDQQRTEMEDSMHRLDAQNADIDTRARQCLEDQGSVCDLTELAPIPNAVAEPERRFTSMGNWHAEFRRNEEMAPLLDIILTHATTGERRVMNTKYYIYDGTYGVTLMAGDEFEALGMKADGPGGQYVLGRMNQVIDPISGTRRTDVCVNDTAHRCHLRVIPIGGPTGGHFDDGKVQIQLTIYNEYGFPLPRSILFSQRGHGPPGPL